MYSIINTTYADNNNQQQTLYAIIKYTSKDFNEFNELTFRKEMFIYIMIGDLKIAQEVCFIGLQKEELEREQSFDAIKREAIRYTFYSYFGI